MHRRGIIGSLKPLSQMQDTHHFGHDQNWKITARTPSAGPQIHYDVIIMIHSSDISFECYLVVKYYIDALLLCWNVSGIIDYGAIVKMLSLSKNYEVITILRWSTMLVSMYIGRSVYRSVCLSVGLSIVRSVRGQYALCSDGVGVVYTGLLILLQNKFGL